MAKALTTAQAELLAAMQTGVICHYMRYAGSFNPTAYYFRSDNRKRCTAQVKALLARGLAEKFDIKPYSGDHHVRVRSAS
jgi:hypothetical protein